jgi:hypothetical protein
MAVIRKSGKVKTILMPVTASTAFTKDTLVKFSSGKLVPCVSGDAAIDIEGVIRHTIASTDADYASDRLVPIEVPTEKHVIYIVDVNASLAATDLGTEYDISGPGTVDHSATSDKVVKTVGYISATKGLFHIKFKGSY